MFKQIKTLLTVLSIFLITVDLIHANEDSFQAPREETILCVALSFNDVHENSCGNIANHVANIYTKNANGNVVFKSRGVSIKIDSNFTKDLYREVVNSIRERYNEKYIIVLATKNGGSHASGRIAHLGQRNNNVATHEVGHLLGFGHSSVEPSGSADKLTPMSSNSSGSQFLLASQLAKLKWLYPGEAYSINAIQDNEEYELKNASDFKYNAQSPELRSIRIPSCSLPKNINIEGCEKLRSVYISFPYNCNDCIAIHLSNSFAFSTQRINIISLGTNESKTWIDETKTGLKYEIFRSDKLGRIKLRIGSLNNE